MDHYSVLGVNPNATKPQIKEAFKKLAMKFHPDKHTESSKPVQNQAISRFKRVSEAYEVLSDDSKRADYDSRCGFGGIRVGNRGGVGSTSASTSTSSFYGGRSGDFDAFKERCRNRYRHGSGGGGFDAFVRFLSSPVVLISIAFARFGI